MCLRATHVFNAAAAGRVRVSVRRQGSTDERPFKFVLLFGRLFFCNIGQLNKGAKLTEDVHRVPTEYWPNHRGIGVARREGVKDGLSQLEYWQVDLREL